MDWIQPVMRANVWSGGFGPFTAADLMQAFAAVAGEGVEPPT
jgi:hypothetical protein